MSKNLTITSFSNHEEMAYYFNMDGIDYRDDITQIVTWTH